MRHNSWFNLYNKNANYRHLLKANLISHFGDWFNFVAITTVLMQLSSKNSIIAYVFIIHLIPFIIFTPLAGVVADKFSRRRIMLNSDIIRCFIVLLYFPAIHFKSIEFILILLFSQYFFATFFEPARSAIIPDVVEKNDLYSANSILAAAWSIMMSLGMSIGGLVVFLTNVETALFFDSISYLISFLYIKKINVEETHFDKNIKITFKDLVKIDDYLITLRYLKNQSYMIPVVLSKGVLEIYTGAFIYFITLYGEKELQIFGSAALSIGLLQAARGIGTGIGPIISRLIAKNQNQEYLILPFWLLLIPCSYLIFSFQTSFWIAIIFVLIAHIGGGANWVVSENIIHHIVPNQIRGRIISFEYLVFTLMMTISVKAGAILLDFYHLSLDKSTQYFSILGICIAIIWVGITTYFFKNKFVKLTNKT